MLEFLLSEAVRKSDLDTSQALLLQQNSQGFYEIESFTQHFRRVGGLQRGYALGLTANPYDIVVDSLQLIHWADLGDRFLKVGTAPGVMERFMKTIVCDEIPIYFFIPPRVFTHPLAGNTKSELQWCLNNPGKLSAVYFIFGLYDLASDDVQRIFHEVC